MTNKTTDLFRSIFVALTLGVFAVVLAAPVTIDSGMLVEKSAFAKQGRGGDDVNDGTDDDGTADQGGGNDDDAPDAPDAADDDGTADQGPGDN